MAFDVEKFRQFQQGMKGQTTANVGMGGQAAPEQQDPSYLDQVYSFLERMVPQNSAPIMPNPTVNPIEAQKLQQGFNNNLGLDPRKQALEQAVRNPPKRY